jgi:protoporphyrinogen oxidase
MTHICLLIQSSPPNDRLKSRGAVPFIIMTELITETTPIALNVKTAAVIGAGPAGLSAAYKLQQSGVQVTVFEASSQVGGMAGSFNLWGQIVDFGPHRFFSSDPRINEFWLDVVGNEYVMVNRLTRIFYKNRFFSYPIQAFNALIGLGLIEAIRCVLSYVRAKVFPIKDESKFDAWVINRFGKRLFEIFFKSYTEKLWGIKCSVLDADFAAQRIKKLSLFEAIKGAILGNRKNQHRTLIDEFAYPNSGAGHVYKKLADRFVDIGGDIRFKSEITDLKISEDTVSVVFNSIESLTFDVVISSMPLTQLVEKLDAPSELKALSRQLKFRNTILVYLKIQGHNPFPDQWIYVHEENLMTGRITNFRNWTSTINNGLNDHIICLEYWCYDEDELWHWENSSLIQKATDELYATGLVDNDAVDAGFVKRVPKCYPVYSAGYRELLDPIQDYFRGVDRVIPIGRYGSFKYNNQDHSILMGILVAQKILVDKQIDLWSVNTDYEYQESTRITATGLIRE